MSEKMTLNTQLVQLEVEGPVATVTINNPPVNVLSPQVIRELDLVLQAVEENSHVWVVVLTSPGEKVFVAGADIKAMQHMPPEAAEKLANDGQHAFQRLQDMYKVTICAMTGTTLGGGLELAMACDIRICASTAKLGQPEINLGLIPGWGGTQRLPRLVGMAHAKEMILSGEPIDAQRAYEIGLVNHVTAPQDTLAKAWEIAQQIASKGPAALHYAQKCIDRGMNMTLEEGLKLEATSFGVIFGTQDKTEGIQAFLEKRKPEFKGR